MEPITITVIVILGTAFVVGLFYVLYRVAKYGAGLGIGN